MDDMVATKGIEFQQSYTIQLGGDHIYRFMNHCEEILSMTLILENILKSKTNQTQNSVEVLFDGLAKLFNLLYFINDAMLSMETIDDETIEDVQKSCIKYCELTASILKKMVRQKYICWKFIWSEN